MEAYIVTIESTIDTFNQYVRVDMGELKHMGDITDNIMTKLFKAYRVAPGA